MKEFEKWWDRVGQYEFSTYLTKEQSKIVWRAALEMVESWLDYSTEHKEIKDKIHDELEGGD